MCHADRDVGSRYSGSDFKVTWSIRERLAGRFDRMGAFSELCIAVRKKTVGHCSPGVDPDSLREKVDRRAVRFHRILLAAQPFVGIGDIGKGIVRTVSPKRLLEILERLLGLPLVEENLAKIGMATRAVGIEFHSAAPVPLSGFVVAEKAGKRPQINVRMGAVGREIEDVVVLLYCVFVSSLEVVEQPELLVVRPKVGTEGDRFSKRLFGKILSARPLIRFSEADQGAYVPRIEFKCSKEVGGSLIGPAGIEVDQPECGMNLRQVITALKCIGSVLQRLIHPRTIALDGVLAPVGLAETGVGKSILEIVAEGAMKQLNGFFHVVDLVVAS